MIFERKEVDLSSILGLDSPHGKQDSLWSHTEKLLTALSAVAPISYHFRGTNIKSLKPSNSLKSIILSLFLSAVVTKDWRNILQISTIKLCYSRNVTWEMYRGQVWEVDGVNLRLWEALSACRSLTQAHQPQGVVQACRLRTGKDEGMVVGPPRGLRRHLRSCNTIESLQSSILACLQVGDRLTSTNCTWGSLLCANIDHSILLHSQKCDKAPRFCSALSNIPTEVCQVWSTHCLLETILMVGCLPWKVCCHCRHRQSQRAPLWDFWRKQVEEDWWELPQRGPQFHRCLRPSHQRSFSED